MKNQSNNWKDATLDEVVVALKKKCKEVMGISRKIPYKDVSVDEMTIEELNKQIDKLNRED